MRNHPDYPIGSKDHPVTLSIVKKPSFLSYSGTLVVPAARGFGIGVNEVSAHLLENCGLDFFLYAQAQAKVNGMADCMRNPGSVVIVDTACFNETHQVAAELPPYIIAVVAEPQYHKEVVDTEIRRVLEETGNYGKAHTRSRSHTPINGNMGWLPLTSNGTVPPDLDELVREMCLEFARDVGQIYTPAHFDILLTDEQAYTIAVHAADETILRQSTVPGHHGAQKLRGQLSVSQ